MRKTTFLKTFLVAACLLTGTSAWADYRVGATDYSTGYLGAKSTAYDISVDGTWTFTFKQYNKAGTDLENTKAWNGFVLNGNDGTADKFNLRCDNYEAVSESSTNCTDTWSNKGNEFCEDINGSTVNMTVTRNSGTISVSASITSAIVGHDFTKSYTYSVGENALQLYLSVDNSYIVVSSAKWDGGTAAGKYEFIYGTPAYSGTTFNGGTAQTDFGGDANELTGITHTDANGATCDAAMPIAGSVLNQKGNWTKYFGTAKTEGKVYFACNYSVINGQSDLIRIVDSKGTVIFSSLKDTSGGKNGTLTVATICGTEIKNYVRNPRTCNYGVRNLCIDLDNRNVTYTLLVSSGNNSYSTLTGTLDLPEGITDVKGLSMKNVAYDGYIDNVLLYSYTPAGTLYTHTLKAINESSVELATLSTTNIYAATEGDAAEDVYYSKAIEKGGVWYVTSKNGSTPGYGYHFAGATETKNITYTADENLVYFGEAEDMLVSGSWAADGAYLSWRSNGGCKRLNKQSYIATSVIAPGVYEVSLWVRNNRSAGDGTETLPIYLRDTDGNLTNLSVSFPGWARGGYEAENSATITIPDDGKSYSIAIYNDGIYTSNLEMDYVAVYKKNTTATIAAAGWASLFTPYALDFSGVTGLTAYTATVSGTTVTLTKVENVPANTGVVLKGAADNYPIPVIASSSTAKGDLKGSATDDKAYDTSYDYYYLAINGSGDAQFKKLTSGSIAAGKAYLQLPYSGGAARELSIVFDDETTGVRSIDNGKLTIDNSVYDLSGRRVAKPTKGLYIVNGKKVAVK